MGSKAFRDRKSTRLNSSHTVISYAVFCLKLLADQRDLHSFPTRRSSDLSGAAADRKDKIRRSVPLPVIIEKEKELVLDHGAAYVSPELIEVIRLFGPALGLGDGVEGVQRSEEHTSELQSHSDLVCRLLLETARRPTRSTLFPYTTLFRSVRRSR